MTNKWVNSPTDPAGPIMVKRVNEAIRKLSWEGKTSYRARTGFFGDPVDPDDLKWSTTSVFLGGSDKPLRTAEAAQAIWDQFDGTVTKKNYKAVVEAFQNATAEAGANRPIEDERPTREEKAETTRICAEIDAERKIGSDARDAVKAEVLAIKPDWADALIVAELKQDQSDSQTDYFANTSTRSVAIGWRKGKREDFKQLHRAAASFSETAHLESQETLAAWAAEAHTAGSENWGRYVAENAGEHRDNYSMGQGNYLSDHGWDGSGSGWTVKSRSLDGGYSWWTVTEIAPELKGVTV